MGDVVKPVRIESAFADPAAVRAMIERNGPYRAIAATIPQSPAGESTRRLVDEAVEPWFRGNFAVGGRGLVDGADELLHHPPFVDAAQRLFATPHVHPQTIVVNINAPMPPGPLHVDIPSFRGATRDRYPLRLLIAMGASGLFEPWRAVEAGAIVWFYDGQGGEFQYWPDGVDGPMRIEAPPFVDVAIVADNDRMYHRVGRIGALDAVAPRMSASATIDHDARGRWTITDVGEARATYPDAEVRLSLLWKAEVGDRVSPASRPQLSVPQVIDAFTADLGGRGRAIAPPVDALLDDRWIDEIHHIYCDA